MYVVEKVKSGKIRLQPEYQRSTSQLRGSQRMEDTQAALVERSVMEAFCPRGKEIEYIKTINIPCYLVPVTDMEISYM